MRTLYSRLPVCLSKQLPTGRPYSPLIQLGPPNASSSSYGSHFQPGAAYHSGLKEINLNNSGTDEKIMYVYMDIPFVN
jgi:hypothetical protein